MRASHDIHVADLMTVGPVTVTPSTKERAVEEIFDDGRIELLPVVDHGKTAGLWIRADEGKAQWRDASSLGAAGPSDGPEEAIDQLLSGKEAVLVWDEENPVGILTRSDIRRLLIRAVEVGLGRRAERPPLILRFFGSDGAGKTTLLMRTLPLVRHAMTGVIGAGDPPEDFERHALEGSPAVYGEDSELRSGLDAALDRLGNVELVFFENRGTPEVPPEGVGEDIRILVVSVTDAPDLTPSELRQVQAVVVTKLDLVPEFDLQAFRSHLVSGGGELEVFGVAAAIDDRGLDTWRRWLQRNYLPRVHWR